MSVAVILQALGWVSAVGLVTVHLMIKRGRLRSDGRAYRIAGCAAAASVVAASGSAGIWPVAVLGLLWLRIEVFGHRHHVPENQFPALGPGPVLAQGHVITAGQAADRPGDWAGETSADRPGDQPIDHGPDPSRQPERMPWFLAGAMDRGRSPARGAAKTKTKGRARPGARPPVPQQVPQQHPHRQHPHLPHPHLPHPHLPHPHLPHPHLGRRTVDRVFKVEMGIVISIALVLFVIWAEEQRASFRTTTDYVVCNWIEGC